MQKFARHEVVSVDLVKELPDEAQAEREILSMQDIQSVLLVPLFAQGALIGFIGFDAVREPRMWSPPDIVLLQIVADLLSSALQRLEAEVKLHEQDIRLSLALAASNDGLFDYDLATDTTYISPNITAALGYASKTTSTAMLLAEDAFAFIHPDDLPMVRKRLEACVAAREPLNQHFRVLTASGEHRWYRIRGQVVAHPLTNRMRLVGLLSDVTEMQQYAKTWKGWWKIGRRICSR
ncbi:MAG: PAS domain-containing protein [Caldilineaceae bacterium]